eukprot:9474885-Pyramimonas_sp.AAC.1
MLVGPALATLRGMQAVLGLVDLLAGDRRHRRGGQHRDQPRLSARYQYSQQLQRETAPACLCRSEHEPALVD